MRNTVKSLAVLVIAGITSLTPSLCGAEPVPKLQRYFEEKIQKLELTMAVADGKPTDPKQKPIVMEDINIDVIPTVSIGVSEVLNLQISPEIDFVLQPDPVDEK
jgi:hypothetical protein